MMRVNITSTLYCSTATFYCIYGNDHEVSCSGFLFNGSSHLVRFTLNEKERKQLDHITEALENEFTVSDSLQEEMLRILLKRFIYPMHPNCPSPQLNITREKESGFEIVRQYYNLVDRHYRTEETGAGLCRYVAQISPRHYRTSFLTCKCLRRYGSFTNGWKRS